MNQARPPSQDDAAHQALAWLQRARAEDELLAEVALQVRRHRRRRALLGGGAAALLALALGWPLLPSHGTSDLDPPGLTATVLQPERQALPDGSSAELKLGSRIAIAFSDAQRRVVLVRGEAHFAVAKNPARPFVVVAGGVEVRAVGTAFAVQLGRNEVEVVVTEGSVAVEAPGPPDATAAATLLAAVPQASATISAGHRVRVELAPPAGGASLQPVSLTGQELADRLAWRIPQLEFSRTPLPEVIALMNQHGTDAPRVRLVVADAALREVKLSGLIRADNTEGLVRLLETNFGVHAERAGTTIELRQAR